MKIFISGIDTDAGKSYSTGYLARKMAEEGVDVITMKFIQTGNHEFSEDIDVHRRIMGCGMLPDDLDHTTAPVIFSYPCSPQLAARLDNREIDLATIDAAADKLDATHGMVLIEGAGGLMVPLTDEFLTIDYPATRGIPVALVTNGRLGSISHTLLALDALRTRGIKLSHLLYNRHFDSDPTIADDTRSFLQRYLTRYFPEAEWIDIPSL